MRIPLAAAAALAALAVAMPAQAENACNRLTALRIPDVRIVKSAEVRPDPVWMAPLAQPPGGYSAPVRKAFCRVEGTIEDEIGFELWLPVAAEWNGRLLGTGNGGFAGFIRYEGLARGINRGFASASTDTGHKIAEINWTIGHPRRLENYGHRAQHLLAVNAKAIIAAHYGRASDRNYFMGCSGGGMQGMNEVQKYPSDYDGIIAGAHGRSIVGISARWLNSALIAKNTPAAHVTSEQWRVIAAAAIKACDAKDDREHQSRPSDHDRAQHHGEPGTGSVGQGSHHVGQVLLAERGQPAPHRGRNQHDEDRSKGLLRGTKRLSHPWLPRGRVRR